jgi:hypothetical protein
VIYFIQADGIGHIKIGYTDDDASARLASLQTGCPVPLRLLHTMPGTMGDEKNLHRRFASANVGGEWFKPVTELMELIPDLSRPACGAAEVVEKSVSIRVLTVGRKQFTKSLLDQLPEHDIVDWFSLAEHLLPAGDPTLNVSQFVTGDVWGWLSAPLWDLREYRDGGDGSIIDSRWILAVRRGRLCKSRSPANAFSLATYVKCIKAPWGLLDKAFLSIRQLPGFRDEDQLFIGV